MFYIQLNNRSTDCNRGIEEISISHKPIIDIYINIIKVKHLTSNIILDLEKLYRKFIIRESFEINISFAVIFCCNILNSLIFD